MLARDRLLAAFVELVRPLLPGGVRLARFDDLPLPEEELPAVVLRAGEVEIVRAGVSRPAALDHAMTLIAEIYVKAGGRLSGSEGGAEARASALAAQLLAGTEGARLDAARRLALRSIGEIESLAAHELPGVRLVLTFEVRYRTREGEPEIIV